MSILASVTEIEDRVVDTVRSLQQPVVDYVRKGVERTEGRLPKVTYPENLPRPSEIVESQVNFAKALLDAQRDFVNDLVDAVSPLMRPDAEADSASAPATEAGAATGSPAAAASAPEAAARRPRPKSNATRAKK